VANADSVAIVVVVVCRRRRAEPLSVIRRPLQASTHRPTDVISMSLTSSLLLLLLLSVIPTTRANKGMWWPRRYRIFARPRTLPLEVITADICPLVRGSQLVST